MGALLGTVIVLGLGYKTGEAGGRLVYEHGAAQAYVKHGGALPVGHGELSKDGENTDSDN